MISRALAQGLALKVLSTCLAGESWKVGDIDALVPDPGGALFKVVAEGLADRFEPRLNDCYADIFSYALARVTGLSKSMLKERYERVRRGQNPRSNPAMIVLLSRVTLGADIVLTSVIARALRHRFPRAQIYLAGDPMTAQLLGLPVIPVSYPREGSLAERVNAMNCLRQLPEKSLIVDPDTRMTQLGLLPITTEDRYCYFESRADGKGTLLTLTKRWCERVLNSSVKGPLIFPDSVAVPVERPAIAISLGVGGNSSKRIDGAFERELIRALSRQAAVLILDKGNTSEEAERVTRAAAGISNVRLHEGTFPAWVGLVALSDLYVGYDSAGQHAAAALGVPTVSLFAGAVCDRFYERWAPSGHDAIAVIRSDGVHNDLILGHTLAACARCLNGKKSTVH